MQVRHISQVQINTKYVFLGSKGGKYIKPNEFRSEFIKFNYNQILKEKKFESMDRKQIKNELINFGNEAIDDPYMNRKGNGTIGVGTRLKSYIKSSIAPSSKTLKAVAPLAQGLLYSRNRV